MAHWAGDAMIRHVHNANTRAFIAHHELQSAIETHTGVAAAAPWLLLLLLLLVLSCCCCLCC